MALPPDTEPSSLPPSAPPGQETEFLSAPESPAAGAAAEETQAVRSLSPLQQRLRQLGWTFLFFGLLALFTVFKLPQDRIRAQLASRINAALAEEGITITSEARLSIGFGISYIMKDATVTTPTTGPIRFDEITVTPALLPMVFRKVSADFEARQGEGRFSGFFSKKDIQKATGPLALSFSASKVDLRKSGLIPLMAGMPLQAGGIATGSGRISGDFSNPGTLQGALELKVTSIVVDAQSIQGFSIPRISVSDAEIDFAIDKGKGRIKTFRLGKPENPADDARATVTGEITMGRNLDASTLNLRARFGFSENILKQFSLLDALFAPAKQPDGTYIYDLRGPLYAPEPTPVPAGSAGAG